MQSHWIWSSICYHPLFQMRKQVQRREVTYSRSWILPAVFRLKPRAAGLQMTHSWHHPSLYQLLPHCSAMNHSVSLGSLLSSLSQPSCLSFSNPTLFFYPYLHCRCNFCCLLGASSHLLRASLLEHSYVIDIMSHYSYRSDPQPPGTQECVWGHIGKGLASYR